MANPRDIKIADYTYTLPEDKIAKFPLKERDQSKLLVYDEGDIKEDIYRNIAAHLPEGGFMVFNDTRVVNARLLFPRDTGSVIEVFCLEPDKRYADITTGMMQRKEVYWRCMVGKVAKWKEPQLKLEIPEPAITITAQIAEKLSDSYVIHLKWDVDVSFAEILQLAGAVPLPPYIKRTADAADKESYQTIYSKAEGSVAAPTAGLHFTEAIFEALRARGIQDDFVTLHVGAGTFKPVKAKQMADHEMHAEWIDVRIELLERLKDALQSGIKIIAVGTTATRTLESLYWLGVKAYLSPQMDIAELTIKQWDVYEIAAPLSSAEALGALVAYLKSKGHNKVVTKTQLLIAPGYAWKIVDRLVTNFHQPDSTLLLLVAAFIGDDWHKVYEYALAHDFRFLSYGDGCLLKRN